MSTYPATMSAVEISEFGGPEVLKLVERPTPEPGQGEVLIKVAAAGVNRGDCVQRIGFYPAPPGASDLPGLEVSGTIVATGQPSDQRNVGEIVHGEFGILGRRRQDSCKIQLQRARPVEERRWGSRPPR